MSSINPGITSRKQLQGKAYWRSLDELADTAEFHEALQREFPAVATEAIAPSSRRDFLKVMGASLALAGLGLTACRMPQEKIAPYAYRAPGINPGVPRQFATALELGGAAQPILVTSYDGRPIKVEGNPTHPASLGSASALAQASLLDMYDPDRSKHPVKQNGAEGAPATWEEFFAEAGPVFEQHRASGGAGLRVLSRASASPSLARLRREFGLQYPQAQWVEYSPINNDNELAGTALAAGSALRIMLQPAKAQVICSLDADFLGSHPDQVRHAREFAAGRKVTDGRMNRLYVAESTYSVTGTCADHRLAVRSGEIAGLACAIALEVSAALGSPVLAGGIVAALEHNAGRFAGNEFARLVAADLLDNRGHGLLCVGPQQPPAVHALALLVNAALGNTGSAVVTLDSAAQYSASQLAGLRDLVAEVNAGTVTGLVILEGNPAYDAPRDLDFAAALPKVQDSFHLSTSLNETSALCKWHLNAPHYLESWGDTRAWDGTYSVVQPLIEPLYGGKSALELVAWINGTDARTGYELTRRTFAELFAPSDLEAEWRKSLHDGLRPDSSYRAVEPATRADAVAAALSETKSPAAGWEIAFLGDYKLYDGSFANNGWLQELPEPLTKLAWDNAALLSLTDADKLGVRHGDMLAIDCAGQSLELPAYILPGQAEGSVCVRLGYGRAKAGRVGNKIGFDTYVLRSAENPWFAPAEVRQGSGSYKLVATQDHHLIDTIGFAERERRVGELVRTGTLAQYIDNPQFAREVTHHPPLVSLWQEKGYETGHRWAMAIDLSTCTGCGACVVACQAENNIPVVGRRRVKQGREMHWIRIDRYFSGDPADARVVNQPVTCHHCEMAPCEQVCPVAATVHTAEGLNDMVYNRCVGTRYCSNNCPYKVRRFNYFNFRKGMGEVEKLAQNPEVTVRSRGVMEKCSFCVQRIQAVKIQAKNDGREITDGEITPACAQTCPSQAIVFGDLNDTQSRVRKAFEEGRAYGMLAELNVKPRLNYLAKLTNPAGEPVAAAGPAPSEHH